MSPRLVRAALTECHDEATTTRLDGLRIAVINWRDPWQDVAGGAEEYAWQMSRQLLGHGAAVHFVTSRGAGQARRDALGGIAISRMGGTFSRYPLVLAWLLRHRRRFDAVIDCMNGIPFFSPLVLPRKVPVVCLVHHVHDQQFFVHFPAWLACLGKILEGPVARRVYRTRVTAAVSPSTVRAMRNRLSWPGPIFVIPNGTPPAQPVNVAHRPAGGDPAIVCVGRLAAHKRVERVLDLVHRLRPRWPDLMVHIVGRGGAYQPLCRRVEAEGLHDHVRLHGFLPEPDKNTLLTTARLHISTSQFEGWGLSVIEAAALGVPTVAYDVDGLRDSIRPGVTGWLAASDEDFVDVVERALKELSDPVRRAEVRSACASWARSFTWASSGERMARLLVTELTAAAGRDGGTWRSRPRTGGDAYVAHYIMAARERSVLVENTDPVRLRGAITGSGGEVREIRPATAAELLLGRAGAVP